MRILLAFALIFTSHTTFAQGDYCIALRGNGEAAPAHWGAIAQLVEKLGLPSDSERI
jgi:hypothetical protein